MKTHNLDELINNTHDAILSLKDTRPDLVEGLWEVISYIMNIRDIVELTNV